MADDRRADRAVILLPVAPEQKSGAGPRLEETRGLAEALTLEVVAEDVTVLRRPSSATYLGAGKVEEVGALAEAEGAGLVIVDAMLSPVQQRNLERAWKAKVIDRTQLILEIFGLRAATREGRLQVELARLAYERSRLVRTWTHLERQRGGGGFLAGPGETQIEADRRILSERIASLRKQLEQVRRTRGVQRASRARSSWPVISLIGYTNAGKSTLFNRLSGAGVLAKNMPFATLDPTLRAISLPGGRRAILSDTVGFISDLPTDLVAAFRATLEEVAAADLLIHVRDISDPLGAERKADVEAVLDQIGAGEESGQLVVEAWNKADLLDEDERAVLAAKARVADPLAAPISAETGAGLDALLAIVDSALLGQAELLDVVAGPQDAAARAWLHEHGEVVEETPGEDGSIRIVTRLAGSAAGKFRQVFPEVAATAVRARAAE